MKNEETRKRQSGVLSDHNSFDDLPLPRSSPHGFPSLKFPKIPGLLSKMLKPHPPDVKNDDELNNENEDEIFADLYREIEDEGFTILGSDPIHVLIVAIRRGDSDKALKIIDSGDIRLDVDGHMILVEAAESGNFPVVARLIHDRVMDPSFNRNEAIRRAAKNGHLDIVRLFVDDKRVKDQERRNTMDLSILGSDLYETTLENAAVGGHVDIIRFIVEEDEAPSTPDLALRGIMSIVLDGKLAYSPSEALIAACYHGQRQAAIYLLDNTDALADAGDNEPIRFAAAQGHLDIVRHLVTVEGVDPSIPSNVPLKEAARNGHADVVEYLLRSPSVRIERDLEEAVELAQGHPKVVDLLKRELGW